jgi:ferric-dicitrate binding protein FerR (iron transport regulator)
MAGHETQALWALAAGELDGERKAHVEAHVAACAACAAELKQVEAARARLHSAREVRPEVRWEETGAKLREAAAKRMARPERRFTAPWALTLAGACALVLLVWLGGAVWRRGRVEPDVVVAGAGEAARQDVEDKTRTGPAPKDTAGQDVSTGTDGSLGQMASTGPGTDGSARQLASTGPGTNGPTERDSAHGPGTAVARAASSTEAERASGAVVREAGGAERTLAAGMRLRSGMAVRTPPKASAVLRLPDESRVRVSAGSDVVLARAESNAVHLTVQRGRLSVNASHAPREGFLVESAGLRVTVVGTVFSVERTSQGAAVAVLEGRVRVDADGQPPRFVDAGQRVELAGTDATLKPRALSASDRQAFRDLRASEPGPRVASVTPPAPAPKATQPDAARLPSIATAPDASERDPAPRQTVASASNPLEPAPNTEIPQAVPNDAPPPAVAVAPRTESPTDDFAPYPGAPSPAPLASSAPTPGAVQAPSMAPPTPVEPRKRKTLGALVPGGLMSDDSDERFLGYARVQSSASQCGGFLVGLGEIAAASPSTGHREQARILRGRCFSKMRKPADAEDEFRQYLREFPNGRYATEARVALGMSAEPEPGPAPRPQPVTPRWNGAPSGAPQRVPVSPGVPRRW